MNHRRGILRFPWETSLRSAFLVTLSLVLGVGSDRTPPRAPDVLVISIEDMRPFLGCYGDQRASTPNIDALAARGVLFERAYCQVPLCNPSRASVSSGLRPETTGVFGNRDDWLAALPEGHRTVEERFQAMGYRTVRCSKIHHDLDKDVLSRASRQRERGLWSEILRPAPQRGTLSNGTRPAGPKPPGLGKDDYNRRTLRWGSSELEPAQQLDGMNALAVAERLTREREDDAPLYIALGLKAPHYPLFAPSEFVARFDPQAMPLPTRVPGDLADVPYEYGLFHRADDLWLNDEERRQVLAHDYACIAYVDHCVGLVLDALEASGRLESTLVCLWSDHGMHFGEHGLYRKNSLFEETARVPLILAGPGIASGRVQRPVELVDLYPTLLELCEAEPDPALEGRSLGPWLREPERSDGAPAAAFTSRLAGQRSLRTARYRYTEWGDPSRAELYDHETDPGEHHNLAEDPAQAELRRRLSARLAAGLR